MANHVVSGPAYWKFLGKRIGTPYEPLAWQYEAHQAIKIPWPGVDSKTSVPYPTVFLLNCGRRAGKTTLGEILLWDALMAPEDSDGPPTVRVTADTEEHGRKIWDQFINHLENTPLSSLKANYSRERELVTLINGATAQLLSANNPNALSGDGVTAWLIDESQFLSHAAWVNLFPSTADRNGVIVMLGVAQGTGPFRTLCRWGDSLKYPEFKRLVYPTSANPRVSPWRIEFARRTMTPVEFKQLYLAQWEGELGKIFRALRAVVVPRPILTHEQGWKYTSPHLPGHHYYGGLDLGRLQDYTVHTIWDRNGRLVAWDRYYLVDWELQKDRIKALSAAYGNPRTAIDATGVGDPVHDNLLASGLSLEPYRIATNQKKRVLVDELAIRIGSKRLEIPEISEAIEEFEQFEARRSKSETSEVVIYSAPSGGHDDWVMSAALATLIIPKLLIPPAQLHLEELEEEIMAQKSDWDAI